MENALVLQNISKSFGAIQALSALNLECRKGEILVLLGENGAGKSTLVSLLAGLSVPDTGSIFIEGKKTLLHSTKKSFQNKIGVVFQHSTLVSEFTVLENLLLYRPWYKKKRTNNELEKYTKIAKFLEIDIDPNSLVKNLSFGEQQLVELIRALWLDQNILLFDELTAHLTRQEVEKLGKTMQFLAQKGCSIVFITHKLAEAIAYADKICVLQKGQKTLEITKKELEGFTESLLNTTNKNILLEDMLYSAMFSQVKKRTQTPERSIVSYDEPPIFCVQSVSSMPQKGEIAFIKNISFDLYKGEILGIAGFDGQGQKILAEALVGQRTIYEGKIFLHKNDISQTSLRKRQELGIFYVSDDRLHEGIAKEESIGINLQLKNTKDKHFFKYFHIIWKRIKKYAKETMEECSISSKHRDSAIHCLSGGNIQKVIVKRELSQKNAKLLVLHQPSYGIDLKTKLQLHTKFLEETKKGRSFILISSDIDELLFLSHRLVIIQHGELGDFFVNNQNAYEKLIQGLTRQEVKKCSNYEISENK